ncbi:MAG: GNAT family N-acetyltransferase [Lachnospiraceae bacterium]|nr:GNAT family N-acetyltransferase [Lachnospiraceae bacterium]
MEEKDGLYLIKVFDEKGRKIGRCKGNLLDARLNGATIKAMALGAVNVEPEYRRCGIARHCFAMLGRIIEEKNCPVSYLHPFSFPYYRTIGYERVADHRVIEFPIEKLDFIPRHAALERVLPENGTKELEQIYNEFCMERNAIFLRHGTLPTTEPTICEGYTNGGPFTYNFRDPVYYLTRDENGRPDGYLMLRREMIQEHHHLFGTVHIDEICFTSPAAMRRLLGFIRMYDGEVDTVVFHNTGMAPEVEQTLRDYKYIKLQSVPDLCARFHDVPAVLSAMKYPKSAGEFTLRVTDCEKSPFSKKKTEGIWKVAYENEKAIVTELPADSPCDLELEMPALAQLIHGFQSYGRQSAIYTEGVTLHGDCEDFFRAFPNRPCGMYDLF